MVFLTLAVVTFLTLLYYVYFTKKFNYWEIRGVPYVKPTFFFGSFLTIGTGRVHPGKYIGELCTKFEGPYFGFFAFKRPYMVAKEPDFIKNVLIKDFKHFSNRHFVADPSIDPVLTNGLFGIKEPRWKGLRFQMTSFFSLAKIKLTVPLLDECSRNMCDYIKIRVGKNIEAKGLCRKYSTDAIATCIFGILINSFVEENVLHLAAKEIVSNSLISTLKVLSYYYAPVLVKLLKFPFISSVGRKYLEKVFLRALAERQTSMVKRNDLIDIFLALRKENTKHHEFKFTDENMAAQVVTFFSAGFESSASVLAFTLHELCVNRDVQKRLRTEIQTVLAQHEGISYEALREMKYLEMVISESLRKYPGTSFLHRECTEDYVVPETGLTIEKGTPVMIGIYGLHYNEKYFPNPTVFDPERFNEQNIKTIKSCTYLPFGDGPRYCIGKMLTLIIAKIGIVNILTRFSVERNSNTREPITLHPFPIIVAKGGLPVTFKTLSQ